MILLNTTSFEEFKELINSGRIIIIDFWATWCGPCRVISPIFERFSDMEQFSGVEFYKVNVDALEQISTEVGIRAMPTFMAFKDGNKIDELVGANEKGLETLLVRATSVL